MDLYYKQTLANIHMWTDYLPILFILAHATIFSWLEVEIEGASGWAVNMPTSCAFAGWTWYHIAMNILILLTVAAVTKIYNANFINPLEKYLATALVWAFRVVVYFCVEDIMWFVINKHYGIRKYTKNDVFWHADKLWVFGTIFLNWVALAGSILLGCIEKAATGRFTILSETIIAATYLGIACLISLGIKYNDTAALPDKTDCFGDFSTVFNFTTN
jgi:hypothetical protein